MSRADPNYARECTLIPSSCLGLSGIPKWRTTLQRPHPEDSSCRKETNRDSHRCTDRDSNWDRNWNSNRERSTYKDSNKGSLIDIQSSRVPYQSRNPPPARIWTPRLPTWSLVVTSSCFPNSCARPSSTSTSHRFINLGCWSNISITNSPKTSSLR